MGLIDIEPELLWGLYWGNGYEVTQIANIFGCSEGTVWRRMKEYGYPCRSVSGFTFNDRQKEIFEGCMLGDGSLQWVTNHCRFSNYDIHKEYLVWLQKQLGVAGFSHISPLYYFIGAGAPYEYRLETRVIPSISQDYKKWYPYGAGTRKDPHHKIIPKDIELTPIKTLFWYIGDGTYLKEYGDARFTNSLVLEDAEMLKGKLDTLLNVDKGITLNKYGKNSKGNQIYLIRLNKGVTGKFFGMVDSLDFNIPKCYQYKFGG